jgi:hypothetical protein
MTSKQESIRVCRRIEQGLFGGGEMPARGDVSSDATKLTLPG